MLQPALREHKKLGRTGAVKEQTGEATRAVECAPRIVTGYELVAGQKIDYHSHGRSIMPRKPRKKKTAPVIKAIVDVGLDGADGHQRITRTEEMVLVGGSSETHERMQETAIRFAEALESRGRRLQETPTREALELLREAIEKTG
jgi:hypothetical protein